MADRTFPSTFPWPLDMTHRPGRLLSRPFSAVFLSFSRFFRSLKTIDLVQYSKLRGESGAQWALFSYSIYTSSYITKLSFEQNPCGQIQTISLFSFRYLELLCIENCVCVLLSPSNRFNERWKESAAEKTVCVYTSKKGAFYAPRGFWSHAL